jgi:hypothetical protein
MSISIIIVALQIVITLLALVCESGEDPKFAGEKLGYRS